MGDRQCRPCDGGREEEFQDRVVDLCRLDALALCAGERRPHQMGREIRHQYRVFPGGETLGDAKNVKMRFSADYMKMAADHKLCRGRQGKATTSKEGFKECTASF
jgi:hypothetical protein